MAELLRRKKPEMYYKKNRLFLAGQFLSKAKTNGLLSATLSLSLITSAIACIFGMLIFQLPDFLFSVEMSFLMAFCQIYISIIFIIIAFTILSLQQVVDSKENHFRFSLLKKLGTNQQQINKLVAKQLGISFSLPLIMFFAVICGNVMLLNSAFYKILGNRNLILHSLILFLVFLVILYLIYFVVTFKTVHLNINGKKLKESI